MTAHRLITRYKHREQGPRDNLGRRQGDERLYVSRMSEQPLTKDRSRNLPNPSLEVDWETQIEQGEAPLPKFIWLGNADNNEGWREITAQVQAARGAKGERCGRKGTLDLHHRQARRYGGQATIDNAERLGRPCHVHTPTFGDHSRLQ